MRLSKTMSKHFIFGYIIGEFDNIIKRVLKVHFHLDLELLDSSSLVALL